MMSSPSPQSSLSTPITSEPPFVELSAEEQARQANQLWVEKQRLARQARRSLRLVRPELPPPPPPTTRRIGDQLPVELLQTIVDQLHTQELGRFLQASRLFYHLAAPYLYESISIDLSKGIHPLVTKEPWNLIIKLDGGIDQEHRHVQPKDGQACQIEEEEDSDGYEEMSCLHEEEHDDPQFVMRQSVSQRFNKDANRLREAHRRPINQIRSQIDQILSNPLPDRF